MTRAEELARFCQGFNFRRPESISRYYQQDLFFRRYYQQDLLVLEWWRRQNDVKLKTMYVPRWKRKIILAAWIGGELVYDRREDG